MSDTRPELRLAFTEAFRRRGDTVSVVTIRDDEGEVTGMTATSVTSVSADPPLLLVCVNRAASKHALLETVGTFGVSFLAQGQEEIAQLCAMPGSDKIVPSEHLESPEGSPRIKGAAANLDCEIVDTHEHGTHTIFIGRVNHAQSDPDASPLLYHDGRYARLTDV